MIRVISFLCLGACGAAAVVTSSVPARPPAQATGYAALVALFADWRAFQKPPLVGGVPDYSPSAMAAQHAALEGYRRRLEAIDTAGWPVSQQADWHIVRAEMNGLDFDHRVLRPWGRDPAFYVTVFASQSDQPAREGPSAYGGIELWKHRFPPSPEAAKEIATGLRVIPPLLQQAQANLTGDARDLWVFGAREIRQQSADLERLAGRIGEADQRLQADVRRAREATDAFAAWLDAQAPSKRGPSGVGIENYDWYLKHVHLVPYTWREQAVLIERELGRARTFLALEEERNRALPPQAPVASEEEHARRFGAAVTEYMSFLESRNLLTVRPGMEGVLRERIGRFNPGPREFFTEVDYRDPVVMRTHGFHWFDLARMARDPHPSAIRRGPLLYNIFDTRTEGLATGWEEMMLQAGMFDARPRSRELIYILVAQRAARALGDLRMHANQFTLEQAAAFASANTPRGWLRLDTDFVRGEQHLYLRQPSYGTSYLIGKMQIEELLAARRRQLGDGFAFRGFMDELEACGLIPMSLISWELAGREPGF